MKKILIVLFFVPMLYYVLTNQGERLPNIENNISSDESEYIGIKSRDYGVINDGTIKIEKDGQSLAITYKKRIYSTPEDFGAVGDGVTDDTQAMRTAIAKSSIIVADKKYKITDTLNLRVGQNLRGKGIIDLVFDTAKKGGINAASNCIIEGLTINQRSTANSIASGQDNVCILIGFYTYQITTPTNVIIKDCKLNMHSIVASNTISISGANNVLVEDCAFRNYSNAISAGGSHWAMTTSTPSQGTIHPYNITYRNCKFEGYGATNNTTTSGVIWISGSHNILVENCRIVGAGNSAVYMFAGDFGYYYANEEQKEYAYRNIVIRNLIAEELPKTGVSVVGIAPLILPTAQVYNMDITIENSTFSNNSSNNTANGITISNVYGVKVINTTLNSFYVGVYPQGNTKNIILQGLKIRNSRWKGVFIHNDNSPPQDVKVLNCIIENSGTGSPSAGAGVELGNCLRPVISENIFGLATGKDVATFGVRISNQTRPVEAIIENNFVRNIKYGGIGYSVGNVSDTTRLYKISGNKVKLGINTREE